VGNYGLNSKKSPSDVVTAVDGAEWSASGDAGGSADEGVLDAVSDWL